MKDKIKDLCWLIGMGVPLKELRRLVVKEIERQQAQLKHIEEQMDELRIKK